MNIFLYRQVTGLGRCAILMCVMALVGFSGNALAESTEVQELKLKVEVLKKRVQQLESTKRPKTIKVAGSPWHSLQVGLSKTEVTLLLGKPRRIDTWKTGEAWYFPNRKGGEVDFDAEGHVSAWLEP